MRVVEMRSTGMPDVLRPAERPDPLAGPSEVVVDIHAASVNAADLKVRQGRSLHAFDLPHVPGRDFSGIVSQAGAGADVPVGTPVFGVCPLGREGAYAERIAIASDLVAPCPDGIYHVTIASLALVGLTAMVALEECLKLSPDEAVLIQGGAGGVGRQAIRLARHHGAEVAASGRASHRDTIEELGARFCEIGDPAGQGGFNAVLDTIGPHAHESTFAALRPFGRAAFIASGHELPAAPRGDLGSLRPDVIRSRARLTQLAALIAAGTVSAGPIRTMRLTDAAEAHRIVEARGQNARLVLVSDCA